MTDSTTTFGLSWEQIAIAAVCLVVLIGAIYAAMRGGRRRRRRAKLGPKDRMFEHPAAAAPPVTAAREAPSLGSPTSPVRASHMAAARPEPVLVKTGPDATPEAKTGTRAETDAMMRAQAEITQTVKRFKGELDEMRHANVVMERRLGEAEQLIRDLREAQRLLVRGPRTDAPPRSEPRVAAPEQPASDEETTMERARRAISLLRND